MVKTTLNDYRTGGIGALLDEYERAIFELKTILQNLSVETYERIADAQTDNEECRSIQTMMSHVVDAGYAYSNNIRQAISMEGKPYQFELISFEDIIGEIDKMFDYQIETLDGKWNLSYEEIDSIVYNSRHGYTETLEQILEHAIVHILRHRRQIDKFLLKFGAENI